MEKFRKILTEGVNFELEVMDKGSRIRDLLATYERGYHNPAQKMRIFYQKKKRKKSSYVGWSLILPENCHRDIPGLILNPMGVATHLGITRTGEFLPKNRVTHDLSFTGKFSGHSVNLRVLKAGLEPYMFLHVLLRVIHHIIALQAKYPREFGLGKRILSLLLKGFI